jgi:hypothetical protein
MNISWEKVGYCMLLGHEWQGIDGNMLGHIKDRGRILIKEGF